MLRIRPTTTSLPKLIFWSLLYTANAVADNDIASETDLLPTMTISSPDVNAENLKTELTRSDLQSAEMPDLNNVLKNEAGITLNQGSGQMTTAITIRGAGGNGQGMATLDGIPLFGNFAGMFSLSHYPLDAFDQVTVTRGNELNQSSSRTLGGAIHLKTRRMQPEDTFLHLEGGSYDTVLKR